MSTAQVLLLGAIAGFTIFIGLPLGRWRGMRPEMRVFLNAIAIGILTFLLWDVLSASNHPVETALTDATNGDRSWWRFAGYSATFAACFAVGLLTLVYY